MARKSKAGGPSRRKEPEIVDVDAIEEVESGGMGIDEGIVICTALILAFAVYLVYTAMEGYTKIGG